MTASEITTILPTVPADTLTSRCEYYRHGCELDAHVQPELRSIMVVANSTLGALTMYAELAARVKLHMQRHGIRLGPIISHPRSSRWTFLIVPDISTDNATYARLRRMQVALARAGTQIPLPSPGRRHDGFRCWSQLPTGGYRPSGVVVLAAVDACAGASCSSRPVLGAGIGYETDLKQLERVRDALRGWPN